MIIGIGGEIQSGKDTIGKIIQCLSCTDDDWFQNETEKAIKDWAGYYDNLSTWKTKKFAGKLKLILSILTGIPVQDLEREEVKNSKLPEEWIRYGYAKGFYKFYDGDEVKTIMNNVQCDKERYELEFRTNWETTYKTHPTYRDALQYIGTDLFRDKFHDDTWVNALMSEYKSIALNWNSDGITTLEKYPDWIITDLRFPNEAKAIKDRKGILIRVNRDNNIDNNNSKHISEKRLNEITFDYVIDNNSTLEDLIVKVKQILINENLLK